MARKEVEKIILKKPCTKVQYDIDLYREKFAKGNNQVVFQMVFNQPPKVSVKEEYLIFDFVALVSAIGGTMGLCIGFSFREFAMTLFDLADQELKILMKRRREEN